LGISWKRLNISQKKGGNILEITRGYASKLIKRGAARSKGRTIDQGWTWEVIERKDIVRTDKVRLKTVGEAKDSFNWTASEMGRKGGSSRSEKKTKASRLNGRKGGRPRKNK
jgi:hypothetical protein